MSQNTSIRLRVNYTGRVQGVGFRATTKDLAQGRDVSGWVRNDADGGVTLEVQGSVAETKAVLDAVRTTLRRNIATESSIEIPLVPDEPPGVRIAR
ncbi:MAG: acylphosphatase [Planctomycetota bacterium]|nr:acylphosphatase [Planctomycetota bacterium]